MKQTIGHFTLEVIGACAFGVKCDALTDENSHFLKVNNYIESNSTHNMWNITSSRILMLFWLSALFYIPNIKIYTK